jgi:hypothetical protein
MKKTVPDANMQEAKDTNSKQYCNEFGLFLLSSSCKISCSSNYTPG